MELTGQGTNGHRDRGTPRWILERHPPLQRIDWFSTGPTPPGSAGKCLEPVQFSQWEVTLASVGGAQGRCYPPQAHTATTDSSVPVSPGSRVRVPQTGAANAAFSRFGEAASTENEVSMNRPLGAGRGWGKAWGCPLQASIWTSFKGLKVRSSQNGAGDAQFPALPPTRRAAPGEAPEQAPEPQVCFHTCKVGTTRTHTSLE